MATQVNIHEAKSQLSALIAKVLAGEQVTIARAGVPVVDLVVHQRPAIVLGLGKGTSRYDSDTFDDPVPEIIDAVYGSEPSVSEPSVSESSVSESSVPESSTPTGPR